MKFTKLLGMVVTGLAGAAQVFAAPVQIQTFNLHPGWNAIYLEVQPDANTPSEVFQGIQLDSVWTLKVPTLGVEFIQDTSEPVNSTAQWLRFIPTNRVESFQNSLFRISVNHAYLVKVTAPAPVTLKVTGVPQVRGIAWKPDAFLLRGFSLDPSAPPSFATFFRGSKAHYDSVLRKLQPVYRLSATGEWTPVDADDKMASGEAYWVYTSGSSSYQGPLSVQLLTGDGLTFGTTLLKQNLSFANGTSSNLTVRLRDLVNPAASVLSYSTLNLTNGTQFLPLPSPLTVTVGPSDSSSLSLSVRRQDMVSDTFETVLEANDGVGTRILVPVTAGKELGAAEAKLLSLRKGNSGLGLQSLPIRKLTAAEEAQSHAGLWSGTVTINAVSEAHSTDPNTPTPVAAEFNLRILLHVDTNGVTRLLKEVIQMMQEGSTTNNASGQLVQAEPDRGVLVTDFTKLALFKGVALRDGQSQGRRLSSVGFEFAASNTNNYVQMNGSFAVGQSILGTLNLPSQYPTNPFLHRYHPDHDNLAPDFKQFKEEAYSVTRIVQLEFSPPPSDTKTVDYGYNVINGVYRETLKGLHRRDLKVSGTFQLNRLTTIGVLNQ